MGRWRHLEWSSYTYPACQNVFLLSVWCKRNRFHQDQLFQMRKALKDQQDVNLHLRSYIDNVLMNIMEKHPELLEIRSKKWKELELRCPMTHLGGTVLFAQKHSSLCDIPSGHDLPPPIRTSADHMICWSVCWSQMICLLIRWSDDRLFCCIPSVMMIIDHPLIPFKCLPTVIVESLLTTTRIRVVILFWSTFGDKQRHHVMIAIS